MSRKRVLVEKNILYNLVTKIVTLALGIILPRLIIISYGSEINGLLATVTQIFTYMALLEAGIGNSAINALYRPLEVSDHKEANEVVSEARTYFRKVSLLYGLCILLFAVIYPLMTNSILPKMLIVGIILLQGGANFINYYFTAVYNQLLTADGRRYITENLTFLAYVFNSLIKIILITKGFSVITVQVGYFIVSLIKAPITVYYCKKNYFWLKLYKTKSVSRLRERGAFIVHEISNTIFNNTDVFLVSTFCSLSSASVYTVYNLVYSSLNGLLTTANAGLGFILGQNQYKGKEILETTYDIYSSLYACINFIIFTVTYLLIIPFVKLYTQGVTDINYVISGLPMLFTTINLLSGVRATGALLITVSGHADATKSRSIAEAVINLGSSLILVNYFGIRGVLYGTILALLYRSNDIIIYANTKILNRSPLKEYRNIGIFALGFLAIAFIYSKIKLNITDYGMLIVYGFLYLVIVAVFFAILAVVINPDIIRVGMKFIREKRKT